MQWFGKSWGAPICESVEHVPTPVGQLCGWCEEPIEEQDDGLIIPHVADGCITPTPHHQECFIRQTAGSVAHQMKVCSCRGSSGQDHGEMEAGMTKREAAKLAAGMLSARAITEQ